MYFKLNNKILNINSYNNFKNIITLISNPNTYILINNKHHTQINKNNFNNLGEINNIIINPRMRGGFIDSLIEMFVGLFKLVILIPKIIMWVIQLVIWVIRFLVYILTAVAQLFNGGLINIVEGLINLAIMEPINLIKRVIKYIFGNGKNNKEDKKRDSDYKCYGPKDDGTIPTTVLISTILCPPLGVFMMYGITGWIYIIISAVLSLVFYLPGLIYALILFYT